MMMVHMAMVVLWATSNIEDSVYAGNEICQYIGLCRASQKLVTRIPSRQGRAAVFGGAGSSRWGVCASA